MFEQLQGQKVSITYMHQVIRDQGMISFFKKSFHYTKKTIYLILPTWLKVKLARKIERFDSGNIDEIIDFCFYTFGGLIRPVQLRSEFKSFLELARNHAPKTILEVGTDKGGSLFALCRVAPQDATIISLDLPAGDLGGYPVWKETIYKMFKQKNQSLHLYRGNSHAEETLSSIKKLLNNKPLDFLFIDADHTYEGVKRDFDLYSTLVRSGGIIAFHDIAPAKPITEVPIFWNEIKNNYKYVEFIADSNQTGYGIGCIYIP